MVTAAAVWDALRRVVDPELGVNVVDLGLVYAVRVRGEEVDITMTVTAPGCPLQDLLPQWAEEAVAALPGVRAVHVHLTLEPPWTPDRMSPAARAALDGGPASY